MQEPSLKGLLSISDTATSGSVSSSGSSSATWGIAKPASAGIQVRWARHLDEVRQAQKLRFEVFGLEMGARLSTTVPGHDIDLFDDFCEHLLVLDEASQAVIGTYRVLTPAQARRVGRKTSI